MSARPGTVAARAADILTAPIEADLLRVRVEQLAEAWRAELLTDDTVLGLLTELRPDLAEATALLWDLWVDYTDALTDWRACDGPALSALAEVKRCCDDLTGGAPC